MTARIVNADSAPLGVADHASFLRSWPPLKVSVEKDPKNPVYHYRLGLAYSKTGDDASARRELEAALKLNPSFANADEARKILAGLKS